MILNTNGKTVSNILIRMNSNGFRLAELKLDKITCARSNSTNHIKVDEESIMTSGIFRHTNWIDIDWVDRVTN